MPSFGAATEVVVASCGVTIVRCRVEPSIFAVDVNEWELADASRAMRAKFRESGLDEKVFFCFIIVTASSGAAVFPYLLLVLCMRCVCSRAEDFGTRSRETMSVCRRR